MIKLFEIYAILFVAWKLLSFFRGKHKGKSILGKLYLLCSRAIHRRLNRALKLQAAKNSTSKVVELKRYVK